MVLAVILGTVAAACTTQNSVPATAPVTTTTATPSVVTAATTPAVTTTIGVTTATAADRLAEITDIFRDLEERRLQALYDGDREAFAALFANAAYLARDLESFDLVEFATEPARVLVEVTEVLVDRPDCIAARVMIDLGGLLVGGDQLVSVVVLEPIKGTFMYSYVGEGWLCDGSHPLGP